MDFKRARGEEQKRQRLGAILAGADRLLDTHAYRDITLQMLAGEVGFSRANLGHYAKTKEEIFLLLYMRDMDGLCAELAEKTSDKTIQIGEFARLFVAACETHQNFARVGALLYSILEENIPPARLAGYKKHMLAQMSAMAKLLIQLFPFLRSETAFNALHALVSYLVGLYPAAHPGVVQKEAMRLAGYEYDATEFAPALEKFVVVLLRGYEATA